ncbi:MAG: malto-oligosyltrehalose synthase, partial [Bacteroidetes bacterium]|nr:malto-oligosyltrehalose synthase [Bacteroidota bacterium]
MFNPESTYRIQFNKEFNFEAFENIIPYLQQLGIKTIYASPVFKAVPGSMHGYDITDPLHINPEIGNLEQLYRISERLKAHGMNWIQDIVPNHMAFHQDNHWLMDVLEKGQASDFAAYFDIDWTHPLFNGKVILPILGKPLEEAIKNNELSIISRNQSFYLKYFDTEIPINSASATLLNSNSLNKNPEEIKSVIDQQYYVPTIWSDTDRHINYRRFFTINGLISLNIQNKKAFDHYHSLIKTLCKEGIFQGLRVDHIDGLANPTEYLYNLRETVGDNIYITIEKILETGEQLPSYWPVAGTTGYDFLATVNNLFTNKTGIKELHNFYKNKIIDTPGYLQVLEEKKKLILYGHMNGELDNLCSLFIDLNLAERGKTEAINDQTLRKAIADFLIECPVYKYYGNKLPLEQAEANVIKRILNKIAAKDKNIIPAVQLLENAILIQPLLHNKDYNERALVFYQRCMQFTGPLMAKGGEDTAMYIYNSFIGHNDVGDIPDASGLSIQDFHNTILDKQQLWYASINATSTHDTKRGEDVRARLNCLTDIAADWMSTIKEWQNINNEHKINGVPDSNDEYFIYQSLIGCYPMPGADNDNFPDRFKVYIQKALREAKMHTNWAKPNKEYERNVNDFIDNILNKQSTFFISFKTLLNKIADGGIINSFAQVILKFMVAGVPDIYQGCELWDFSMVDPDNRRAVNYELRSRFLNEVDENKFADLWSNRYSGKIKLWLTHKILVEKNLARDTFTNGRYIPLETKGTYKNKILAFARVHKGTYYIVALPLNILAIA